MNTLHIDETVEDRNNVFNAMLYGDTKFDKTFHTSGLQHYISEGLENLAGYYCNFYMDEVFKGRVAFFTDQKSEGIESILSFCCRELETGLKLRDQKETPADTREIIRRALLSVLNGTIPSQNLQIPQYLKERSDTLQLYIFRPFKDGVSAPLVLKYFAAAMEDIVPDSVAVLYEKNVVLLHWYREEDSAEFHKKMILFLRENLMIAGCSQPYSDFLSSGVYYQQASDAITIGAQKNPDFWFFRFSDYIDDYVVSLCKRQYMPENYCPSSLRKLKKYDETHKNSELEETLRIYLRARFSGSKAAELLHIHKTTFFYRLSKIQELSGIDFESGDEVFAIALYFRIVS